MKFFTVPTTYNLADIVLINTLSNTHIGIGRSGGLIDLPTQRDEIGFPMVYSSSIKGALKTALLHAFFKKHNDYNKAKYAISTLLGPEPEEGESFESSIAILDAYLLAIPVRSLKGVYTYVTSPTLLRRFKDRLDVYHKFIGKLHVEEGKKQQIELSLALDEVLNKATNIVEDEALCLNENGCKHIKVEHEEIESLQGKAVLVEEFIINIDVKFFKDLSDDFKKELKKLLNLFDKPLLILHDDVAKEVINRSLIRLARVRLKRETKTVSAGPWIEEYLPTKTIFHTLFLYKRPPLTENIVRRILTKLGENIDKDEDENYLKLLLKLGILSEEIKKKLEKEIKSPNARKIDIELELVNDIRNQLWDIISKELQGFIIIGGKETIGKGIVELINYTSLMKRWVHGG